VRFLGFTAILLIGQAAHSLAQTNDESAETEISEAKAIAAGLAGDGDADGLAWNVALSLMDFKPNHSIGVNYGRVGSGWLLSPQLRPNESLAEIRYQWRRSRELAFDIRVRRREELEQLVLTDRRQMELDFFVRFTWGTTIR